MEESHLYENATLKKPGWVREHTSLKETNEEEERRKKKACPLLLKKSKIHGGEIAKRRYKQQPRGKRDYIFDQRWSTSVGRGGETAMEKGIERFSYNPLST